MVMIRALGTSHTYASNRIKPIAGMIIEPPTFNFQTVLLSYASRMKGSLVVTAAHPWNTFSSDNLKLTNPPLDV